MLGAGEAADPGSERVRERDSVEVVHLVALQPRGRNLDHRAASAAPAVVDVGEHGELGGCREHGHQSNDVRRPC